MPQKTNLNIPPYNDDFDKDKNFHKVLFRPGYPVQARELTTLQTILQNQIENFGSYFFKDGAMVIPGQMSYDLDLHAVLLQSSFLGSPVEEYREQLEEIELYGIKSGVTCKVLFSIPASESEKNFITLYVKYLGAGQDNVTRRFVDNEELSAAVDINIAGRIVEAGTPILKLIPENARYIGSVAYVNRGVYFIRGNFVDIPTQRVILDQYDNEPSYKIGFNISESIITPEDDNSLNDNAFESSNFNAPGAHRFRIRATLVKRPIDDPGDKNFMELMRLDEGRIEQITKRDPLSEIEKTIARRTYDTHGDYITRDFSLLMRESLDDGFNNGVYQLGDTTDQGNPAGENYYALEISPGTAYVKGYEVTTQAATYIDILKSRDTESRSNEILPYEQGNYLTIHNLKGLPYTSNSGTTGNQYETLEFYDSYYQDEIAQGRNITGMARALGMDRDGENRFKLYLGDIQMFTVIKLQDAIDTNDEITPVLRQGDRITGDKSKATGYLVFDPDENILKLYQVNGEFIKGESLRRDGYLIKFRDDADKRKRQRNVSIRGIYKYDFSDIRRINGTYVSDDEQLVEEFEADTLLTESVEILGDSITLAKEQEITVPRTLTVLTTQAAYFTKRLSKTKLSTKREELFINKQGAKRYKAGTFIRNHRRWQNATIVAQIISKKNVRVPKAYDEVSTGTLFTIKQQRIKGRVRRRRIPQYNWFTKLVVKYVDKRTGALAKNSKSFSVNNILYNSRKRASKVLIGKQYTNDQRVKADYDYTFTSGNVDVKRDTITMIRHNLRTGDILRYGTVDGIKVGTRANTNSNSSVLKDSYAGSNPVTVNYYVIRINANLISLATSYSNSIAKKRIDFRSKGGNGHYFKAIARTSLKKVKVSHASFNEGDQVFSPTFRGELLGRPNDDEKKIKVLSGALRAGQTIRTIRDHDDVYLTQSIASSAGSGTQATTIKVTSVEDLFEDDVITVTPNDPEFVKIGKEEFRVVGADWSVKINRLSGSSDYTGWQDAGEDDEEDTGADKVEVTRMAFNPGYYFQSRTMSDGGQFRVLRGTATTSNSSVFGNVNKTFGNYGWNRINLIKKGFEAEVYKTSTSGNIDTAYFVEVLGESKSYTYRRVTVRDANEFDYFGTEVTTTADGTIGRNWITVPSTAAVVKGQIVDDLNDGAYLGKGTYVLAVRTVSGAKRVTLNRNVIQSMDDLSIVFRPYNQYVIKKKLYFTTTNSDAAAAGFTNPGTTLQGLTTDTTYNNTTWRKNEVVILRCIKQVDGVDTPTFIFAKIDDDTGIDESDPNFITRYGWYGRNAANTYGYLSLEHFWRPVGEITVSYVDKNPLVDFGGGLGTGLDANGNQVFNTTTIQNGEADFDTSGDWKLFRAIDEKCLWNWNSGTDDGTSLGILAAFSAGKVDQETPKNDLTVFRASNGTPQRFHRGPANIVGIRNGEAVGAKVKRCDAMAKVVTVTKDDNSLPDGTAVRATIEDSVITGVVARQGSRRNRFIITLDNDNEFEVSAFDQDNLFKLEAIKDGAVFKEIYDCAAYPSTEVAIGKNTAFLTQLRPGDYLFKGGRAVQVKRLVASSAEQGQCINVDLVEDGDGYDPRDWTNIDDYRAGDCGQDGMPVNITLLQTDPGMGGSVNQTFGFYGGGTGRNKQANAELIVDNDGSLRRIHITDAGEGYTSDPELRLPPPRETDGSQAEALAIARSDSLENTVESNFRFLIEPQKSDKLGNERNALAGRLTVANTTYTKMFRLRPVLQGRENGDLFTEIPRNPVRNITDESFTIRKVYDLALLESDLFAGKKKVSIDAPTGSQFVNYSIDNYMCTLVDKSGVSNQYPLLNLVESEEVDRASPIITFTGDRTKFTIDRLPSGVGAPLNALFKTLEESTEATSRAFYLGEVDQLQAFNEIEDNVFPGMIITANTSGDNLVSDGTSLKTIDKEEVTLYELSFASGTTYETSPDSTFTGDLTNGSAIVTNVSQQIISQLTIGATVTSPSAGFPSGTITVTAKGGPTLGSLTSSAGQTFYVGQDTTDTDDDDDTFTKINPGYITATGVVTTSSGDGAGLTVDIVADTGVMTLVTTGTAGETVGTSMQFGNAKATTTNGGGTGFKINIRTLDSNGGIADFTINEIGSGYAVDDLITVASNGGTDAVLRVTKIGGPVTSVVFRDAGVNYDNDEVITITQTRTDGTVANKAQATVLSTDSTFTMSDTATSDTALADFSFTNPGKTDDRDPVNELYEIEGEYDLGGENATGTVRVVAITLADSTNNDTVDKVVVELLRDSDDEDASTPTSTMTLKDKNGAFNNISAVNSVSGTRFKIGMSTTAKSTTEESLGFAPNNVNDIRVMATISLNNASKKTKTGKLMRSLLVNNTRLGRKVANKFGLALNETSSYFGTRVEDEVISLGVPDAFKLHAVYESYNKNQPVPPSMVLVDEKSFKVGSIIKGASSFAQGRVIEISGTRVYFTYLSASKFQLNEIVNGINDLDNLTLQGQIASDQGSVTRGSKVITDRFELESGQRATFYDIGRIIRKPGQAAPKRQILVIFDHYFPSGEGEYLCANSYIDTDYADIPNYENLRLRDVLDFRSYVSRTTLNDGSLTTPYNVDSKSLDFRNRSYTNASAIIVDVPKVGTDFRCDYDYYLRRIDKLFLTPQGEFTIQKGKAARDPIPPDDIDDSMFLGTIEIEPYGFDIEDDVEVTEQEYKRYTFADLTSIEKRLERVEYYTSLSLLETATESIKVQDAEGFDRFKNGFVVDDFSDNNVSDTEHIDYNVSFDFEAGECRPAHYTTSVPLSFNSPSSVHFKLSGDGETITLPYSDVIYAQQIYASTTENVNPFAVVGWVGVCYLNPESDDWVSVKQLPKKIIRKEGNFLATKKRLKANRRGFTPIQWGGWQTVWTGKKTTSRTVRETSFKNFVRGKGRPVNKVTTTTTTQKTARVGIRTRVIPVVKKVNLGNRTLSKTAIPYMRSRNIRFTGKKLKPFTRVYIFFDGKNVTDLCTPKVIELIKNRSENRKTNNIPFIPNEFVRGLKSKSRWRVLAPNSVYATNPYLVATDMPKTYTGTYAYLNINAYEPSRKVKGTSYGNITVGEVLKGEKSNARAIVKDRRFITDINGFVRGVFYIPAPHKKAAVKFATGTRVFKITSSDVNSDDRQIAETTAQANFESSGILERRQKRELRIRNAKVVADTVTQRRTTNSIRTNTRQIGWYDPIAESFVVNPEGGMFITKVDVYFFSKDEKLPVSMQLRTMENGYPTKEILPFSEVALLPGEVKTSSDASVATTFTFPSPIYLSEGEEYCFVLLSVSNNYRVHISVMGQTTYDGIAIAAQPYNGVLFKSQNASTWTASQLEDMKFNLYRAKFDISQPGILVFNNAELTRANEGIEELPEDPIETFDQRKEVRLYGGSVGSNPNNFTDGAELVEYSMSSDGLTLLEITARGIVYDYDNGVDDQSDGEPTTGQRRLTISDISGEFTLGISSGKIVKRISSSAGKCTLKLDGAFASTAFTVGSVLFGNTSKSVGIIEKTYTEGGLQYLVLKNVWHSGSAPFSQGEQIEVRPDIINVGANFQATLANVTTYIGYPTTNGDFDTEQSFGDSRTLYAIQNPVFDPELKRLRINHSHHGMHDVNNDVIIEGVISEVEPTILEQDIISTDGKDANNNNISFDIKVSDARTFHKYINGKPISASNPGYIKIEDEILRYQAISDDGKTITIIAGGRSSTEEHETGDDVLCYNFDGIPLTDINKLHTRIYNPTIDTYEIRINGVASDGIVGGGEDVTATQNVQFEVLTPQIQYLTFANTEVTATVNTISGTSVSATDQTSFVNTGEFLDLELNEINYFSEPRLIASRTNELRILKGAPSMTINVNMTSDKDNVSPQIDLDRAMLICTSNLINAPREINARTGLYQVGTGVYEDMQETQPEGDKNEAIYINKLVRLESPSKQLKLYFNCWRKPGTTIKALYRIVPVGSKQNPEEIAWQYFNAGRDATAEADIEDGRLERILITNQGENYNTKVGVSFFGGLDTDSGTAYHARAEAVVVEGRITQVKVIEPGQGYISAPAVYITPDPLEGGKPDKVIPEDDFENFREYEYTADGLNFEAFQIKIIMQSVNQANVPIIQEFRAIALA